MVFVAIHLCTGLTALDGVRYEPRHIWTGEWLTFALEAELVNLIDRSSTQLAPPAAQLIRDGGCPKVARQDHGHATSSRSNSSA